MKKLIASLLAVVLCVSIVGCTFGDTAATTDNITGAEDSQVVEQSEYTFSLPSVL